MAARMRKAASKLLPSKPATSNRTNGADETGANETGADETGADETGTHINSTTLENAAASPSHAGTAASKAKSAVGRQPKHLNLKTYKDHSLGDYVESIRRNGTVDSYSTEWNWNTAVPNRAISEQAAKILKNN
ncbi:hypothetical protein HYPSUDRAFT_210144 [Hypholoma sublateritium FD-334 SS-4]|uniref:Uncharacterized protein n=1 Tax=Hypholoma sublateritium (strain FD-334 SS-4) TaxID=945553 RepID=A0A0D2N0Q8_HYPSF|nr:hypothetical protein HYPSUDRAFT_210144 [Hypholoma sublateritium FD-334 SS-4]